MAHAKHACFAAGASNAIPVPFPSALHLQAYRHSTTLCIVRINCRFNALHEHDIRLGDGTCELQNLADLERMSGKKQGAQALQDISEPMKHFYEHVKFV